MKSKIILAFVAGIVVAAGLIIAISGIDTPVSQAKKTESKPVEWVPTKPFPQHDVYYPGAEALLITSISLSRNTAIYSAM